MSERGDGGIGCGLVLVMVVVAIFIVATTITADSHLRQIRDLQRRVAILEQQVKQ
jgi:hypothetical protein